MRIVRLLTGPLALGAVLVAPAVAGMALVAEPAAASARVAATVRHLVIRPHGPDVPVPVTVRRSGEAVLDLRVSAPGTDWALPGAESAVVSVSVDGRYVTDLVVSGTTPLDRQLALGRLRAGVHLLRLHLADERSPAAGTSVVVDRASVSTYAPDDPEYRVLRHAPVVYGRSLAELGTPYQNARTDTPLLAWHESVPAATAGHTTVIYSVVWSNEDGGTNTPALMARWGRTTDIEWIYSVELDSNGDRVAGSDIFQAPNHQVLHFTGRYEDDHPLLQTCTANNNMCDAVDDPMRFFLSALPTRPAEQAREYLMDTNPWTYQIMAKEMARERKIEAPSPGTALTPEVSDQRNYLYAAVRKSTRGGNSGPSWVGVALGVRLVSGRTVYLSNHGEPTWSLQRDDPAATTVELPAGTTVADIAEVSVHRVAVNADNGASVHVTAINRGFVLGEDYRPRPSFLTWSGEVVLDAGTPSAVLWRR